MGSFGTMNRRARFYWLFIVALGMAGAAIAIAGMPRQYDVRLLVWVVVAAAVAGFKIRLPGIMGTLSMNYVIILVALLNLDVGAGMIVALTSTLGQCLIHTQERPRWFQVVFSVAGVPLPVLAANLALHSGWVERGDSSGGVALLSAS